MNIVMRPFIVSIDRERSLKTFKQKADIRWKVLWAGEQRGSVLSLSEGDHLTATKF